MHAVSRAWLARARLCVVLLAFLVALGACRLPASADAGEDAQAGTLLERLGTWRDERGHAVTLADLRGSPVVLAPIFTFCTVRCPITVEKVRRLYEAYRRRNLDVRVVLVTLDPIRDDPARLLRFQETRNLPASWRLLRGTLDQTRALARMLGVRAIYDDNHIDHDVRIAVFDRGGRLVDAYGGWDFDEETAVSRSIAREPPPCQALRPPQDGSPGCADSARARTPPASRDELRFDTLRQRIVDTGARSIEDVIASLPASLRSRYVLMHESRSVQEATYRDPRVLLYTEDAKFVLAFNGDPAEAGHLALETLEFNDDAGVFRLREVTFPSETAGPTHALFSDVNPPRCLSCHRDEPQPIWDEYPEWPGAYGAVDRRRPNAEEAMGMASFLAGRRQNPRYSPLLDAESFAVQPLPSAEAYEGREHPSRNADFGAKLQRLAYRAIARRVATAPGFSTYQYALLAALDPQCSDVDAFLPRTVKSHFARSQGAFARDTERANADQDLAKGARMQGVERAAPVAAETLASFRYLAEEGLHLSTRGWALALEPDAYDFTTGRATTVYLERDLLDAVAKNDPLLPGLRAAPERRDGYCAALRRASLAALNRATP